MEIEPYSSFVSLNRGTYSFTGLSYLFLGILRSGIVDRVFEAISEERPFFVELEILKIFARESDINLFTRPRPTIRKRAARILCNKCHRRRTRRPP